MKQITLESIEKAIQKVDNLDDNSLDRMSETFALAQENLLAYLMSAALEYENPNLEGLIIYYFCLILETFNQEGLRLEKITDEQIEAFEQPFFEMLDTYFEHEQTDVLDEFCDQPNLTQFMTMEISMKDDDGTELDDETATQLFIVSVAMIALLNKNIAA